MFWRKQRHRAMLAVAMAIWSVSPSLAEDDPPPIYGALGDPATPMHCHVPPYGADHPPCIVDHATGYEAIEPRYMAWKYGATLREYRIGADLCQTLTFSDWDWVRYWNPAIHDYGDKEPIADGWHYTYDDFFNFNGEGQPYYWSPPTTGSITYWVLWIDDNYPLGTQDPYAFDDAAITVVNNTYAGWSYITVGNRYVSYHAIDETSPPPPLSYSLFDGGKVHARVGDTFWVTESRHVRSYTVDRYTNQSTVSRLDEARDDTYYFYGDPAADNPNYLPGHLVHSTLEPGSWRHSRGHANVAYWMLRPLGNPTINGFVCVVKGTLGLPGRVPNNPGEAPVTITYGVGPAEGIELAEGTAISAHVYNPDNSSQRYTKHLGPGLSGSFQWNGMFDDGTSCPTNAAFGRIKVATRDHWFTGSEPRTETTVLSFEAPILAILYPSHRFRREGGPFAYGDQMLTGRALNCRVGWNPPNLYPSTATIQWTCTTGNFNYPNWNPTEYSPPQMEPGENIVVTISVSVAGDVRSRDAEVFGDDLGRDKQNFAGGTNTYPLPWWNHQVNCHGATHHAHNGEGFGSEGFICPFGGCAHEAIYHRWDSGDDDFDNVDGCEKQRGYIISYVVGWYSEGSPSHSATLTATGTGTWEVNGGVPPSNLFREDTIHKDLHSESELWILLHRPGQ